MQDTEKFYPLKGFEGYYEITKTGIVKRLSRVIKSSYNADRVIPEKIIRHEITFNNYHRIPISISELNIVRKKMQLHRLLATTFIPNDNNLPVINHKDGNPSNNRLDNLEWCTQSHNCLETYRNGYLSHRYTLKEEAVKDIFLNAEKGTYGGVGDRGGNISFYIDKYSTTKTVIYGIIGNKTYKHITEKLKRK